MTATYGVGTYGNAAGTVTPLDHKMANLGQIAKTAANTIRPGLFWDGSATVVSGKANMSYDVRAFTCVTSRGPTLGAVLLSNDAVYNVATTAAPGSNSRYDVVYIWQREFAIDGSDSNPVIGVVQGTAAASPTVPSLAAYPGAIELARILVPSGVTATNSGTTITQTAQFTATSGGVIPFRTTTERDAGTYVEGQLGWLIDSDRVEVYNGASWSGLGGGRSRIIPTKTSTGGAVTVNSATGEVTATGAVSQLNVTIPNASLYKSFEVIYSLRGGTSGAYTIKLLSGSTPNATASSYRGARLFDAGALALTPGTSWVPAAGNRSEHFRKAVIFGLAQAKATVWDEFGGQADATANEGLAHLYMRHTDPVALDGFRFDFTSMGTFVEVSVTIEGLL